MQHTHIHTLYTCTNSVLPIVCIAFFMYCVMHGSCFFALSFREAISKQTSLAHLNRQQTHIDDNGSPQSTANSHRQHWLVSIDCKLIQMTMAHLSRQQKHAGDSGSSYSTATKGHWLTSIDRKPKQTTLAHLNH